MAKFEIYNTIFFGLDILSIWMLNAYQVIVVLRKKRFLSKRNDNNNIMFGNATAVHQETGTSIVVTALSAAAAPAAENHIYENADDVTFKNFKSTSKKLRLWFRTTRRCLQ